MRVSASQLCYYQSFFLSISGTVKTMAILQVQCELRCYDSKIKYNYSNNISTAVTMLYNTGHHIHYEFDLDITIWCLVL